jgi:hypothetical protein
MMQCYVPGKRNDRTFNTHLSCYRGKYICLVLTTLSSKKPWSSVRCCPSNRSVSRSVSGSSVRNNMLQKASTESEQNSGHLNLQFFTKKLATLHSSHLLNALKTCHLLRTHTPKPIHIRNWFKDRCVEECWRNILYYIYLHYFHFPATHLDDLQMH